MAIIGTAGNDRLLGTRGPDRLEGLAGNDQIFGGGGRDALFGGDGNDLLDGGGGADILDGGNGRDTATYAANTTSVRVYLDRMSYSSPVSPFYDAGDASFPDTHWGRETLRSIENIIGGFGDDEIEGNEFANTLVGGAGSDLLAGGSGGDVLDGGYGSDVIYGDLNYYRPDSMEAYWGPTGDVWYPNSFKNPDTLRYDWAAVDLTIKSGVVDRWNFTLGEVSFAGMPQETDRFQGIENIWGGSGNDTIEGGVEDNELRGGAGRDTLRGFGGDDVLWGQGGRDLIDGGEGSDTAVYSDNTTPVRVDLRTQTVTFPGKPWPSETLVSIENAVTGTGDDVLIGTAGDNVFDGGLGADSMFGGGGTDTVSYESHARGVKIELGPQRTTVIGTSVADQLGSVENAIGGSGNDVINGSNGANVLDGGGGNDIVRGYAGDDILDLSDGNDRLDGGAGTDTLQWAPTYDDFDQVFYYHSIYDIEYFDESEFYDGSKALHVLIDLKQGAATKTVGATGTSVIANFENVTTGIGNDFVFGDDAANRISVGHGANYAQGRGGDDVIIGSNAKLESKAFGYWFNDRRDTAEVLRGGAGDDRIVGGTQMFGDTGDDTLVAGWKHSKMTGGAGADRFVFSTYYEEDENGGYISGISQSGEVEDFSSWHGDKVIVRKADPSAPTPVYVGHVDDILDDDDEFTIEVDEFGFVDGAFYVPLVNDYDRTGPNSYGLEITGDFTVDDVLFV